MWQLVAGGLALALLFIGFVALKYKSWVDAEVEEYERITENLHEILQQRNSYVDALEKKVLEAAGPTELARVLNRVFDPDSDDDSSLPGDPSAD